MMLKVFSLATACALILPVASPVFATEDLETIRVIGSRSCSGLCLQNFMRDINKIANRFVERLSNEATLEVDESEAKPEVVMPIAEFDDVCKASATDRSNRVNTEFSSGFANRSFPLGTEVQVYYFLHARERFVIVRSSTPEVGTLKPIANTFEGCPKT